jgi:hypothetical protein
VKAGKSAGLFVWYLLPFPLQEYGIQPKTDGEGKFLQIAVMYEAAGAFGALFGNRKALAKVVDRC